MSASAEKKELSCCWITFSKSMDIEREENSGMFAVILCSSWINTDDWTVLSTKAVLPGSLEIKVI